jgi:hypothetical protein
MYCFEYFCDTEQFPVNATEVPAAHAQLMTRQTAQSARQATPFQAIIVEKDMILVGLKVCA